MSAFDAAYEPSPWEPIAAEEYDAYQAATDRTIPLFVLEPA